MKSIASVLKFATAATRAPLVALALLWPLGAQPAKAAPPKVSFDLRYLVECHDVTPQAFALLHPDEKVIEADLRVSVRLVQGHEADLEELQFELTSPAERLRVVDFVPKTQIENDTVDGTEVVKTTEFMQSLGAGVGTTLSFGGGAGNVHGNVVTQALPNGSASATHRKELKETTKMIPPGKVVVASGTLENEHGVFFKLRRSAKTGFEGAKLLSFRFVVPGDWRGDWIVLSCSATGRVKHYFFKTVEQVGTAKAFVALYLAGDAEAERAGLELAEDQEQYFASKPPAERYDLIITTLATEARPWRDASHTHDLSFRWKTPVTCYKPTTSKHHLFRLVAKTPKCPSAEACTSLKQALDGAARFSAAPGWHVASPAASGRPAVARTWAD